MQMLIKNINVNYDFFDNDSDINIVYLHGWGQNKEMMMPIAKPFIKKHNVLIIDLPGFGQSEEPTDIWTIEEFAEVVHEIVKKHKIKNPIMIGHSFGGKISIIYSLKYEVSKLVLLASPYKQKIKKPTFKMRVYKTVKKIPGLKKLEGFVKKHVGSEDYRSASETMRKILVKHVNLDLTEDVKNIKCPTLLIWGTNDDAVSIEDARELEKLISNCGLVVYEGCTHYAYLERAAQTINVLKSFIGSGE